MSFLSDDLVFNVAISSSSSSSSSILIRNVQGKIFLYQIWNNDNVFLQYSAIFLISSVLQQLKRVWIASYNLYLL